MTDLATQAQALEEEFLSLLEAEELDEQRLEGVVERRNTLHASMADAMEKNPELKTAFKPLFEHALENTKKFQPRCQQERDGVQKQLITLNTSKKANKAY